MIINKKLLSLLAIPFALLGGVISRFHGGGFKGGVNKTLKNFLWALPHCIVIALFNPWLAVLGLTNMLKATGHGRGLGADEPFNDDSKPEKVEYVTLWLRLHLTDRAYKHVIMAATGLVAVSGSVIAFSLIDPLSGAVISLSGLLKGLAYEIGAILLPKQTRSGFPPFQYKTEVGEFLTGIFAYGGVAIAALMAM